MISASALSEKKVHADGGPGGAAADPRGTTFRTRREILEEAAATGDPAALLELGRFLEDEDLFFELFPKKRRDVFGAARCYAEASARGNVEATVEYARCLEHGIGVPVDKEKAEALWREAADAGNTDALCRVAETLEATEPEAAQALIDKARDARADYWSNKAHALYSERKCEADLDAATEALRKVLEFDRLDDFSLLVLGFLTLPADIGKAYEEGDCCAPNPAKAAEVYRIAAESFAQSEAAYRLGRIHEEGRGVAQDSREAEKWYLKAIALDRDDDFGESSVESHRRLGLMLFRGLGNLPENREEAAKHLLRCVWYKEAREALKEHYRPRAEAGDAEAQHLLAELLDYRQTEHGAQLCAPGEWTRERWERFEGTESERWERAAADGGHAEAQFHMWFRLHGARPREALEYLKKAAAQGFRAALEKTGDLYYFGDEKIGVRRDCLKAIPFYDAAHAADGKDDDRCGRLATWCRMNAGVEPDKAFAHWVSELEICEKDRPGLFRTRYEENFPAYVLATRFYAVGNYVPQDFAKGTKLLEIATESGYDDAREELAKWYWTGKPGVPPRRALAVRMFLRQAQGCPYARFVLACAYALGDGVPRRSFRRAARWFASAAALFLEKERDALKWELGRFFRGILPKKKEIVRPPPKTDEPDDSPATERSGA